MLRQAEKFSCGHFDQCEHLAAFGDQRMVIFTNNTEGAPKSRPLDLVEPAFHYQVVRQFCGAPVIDFCSHDYRILLGLGHLREVQAEFFSQSSPGHLDKAQVSDIGNDSTAIGIEKHHLYFNADPDVSHAES